MKLLNTVDWLVSINGEPLDFEVVTYEDSDGSHWHSILRCQYDYAIDIKGDDLEAVKQWIISYEQYLDDTKNNQTSTRNMIIDRREAEISKLCTLTY